MPIKLQVVKEGTEGADPADYLFEQDRITIGRGSENDLTLPDQKVSKQHAEIRHEGSQYLLVDRESKNHTYVNGQRVSSTQPYVLESGDAFKVGDFCIEFVPLFMPSAEQTAFAEVDEQGNPFERHAAQLASALEGLAETYSYAPSDRRGADFDAAVDRALDAQTLKSEAVHRLLHTIRGTGDGPATNGTAPNGSLAGGASTNGTVASAPNAKQANPSSSEAASSPHLDAVLDTLLESVARMITIPQHFWREFSGSTVVVPPEKAFLRTTDIDNLRGLLLDEGLSEAECEERLTHLREAVNTLVSHQVAMLSGYKKSIEAGSKEVLQRVNPTDVYAEARTSEEGGMFGKLFAGGKLTSSLKELVETWRKLYGGKYGVLERKLYRPTYIEAYIDRMADAWGVNKSEIVEEKG